jgi:predicted O-methyltransferase YrrM
VKRFFFLFRFIKYYVLAQSKHGIHSPYIFKLLTEVINSKADYYAYGEIKKVLHGLTFKTNKVVINDFGAGSLVSNKKSKPYNQLLKEASIPPKYGRLLFRLVNHLQPRNILEIGTCLGVSTFYMAKANTQTPIITLEGNPHSAIEAKKLFDEQNLTNIKIEVGEFDTTLPHLISKLDYIDFAFIDGNHQLIPTLHYFNSIIPKLTSNSCIIFHDIHWSNEMEQAWHQIKLHNQVSQTIDLFFLGIVFFKEGVQKQDYIIRY